MLGAVSLVLAVNLALAVASPILARLLPPSTSTRLVCVGSLLGTAAAAFVLSVVAFGFLAQIPDVAALGRWSQASLVGHDPVPLGAGIVALSGVAIAGWAVSRRLRQIVQHLWTAACGCRQLASYSERLVIVEDPQPDAYAVAGLWGGRVVVTSAMLAILDADERRVLLAHEESHLRHRHHLYVSVTDLAASANPLLRGLRGLVRATIERWADEDAARVAGDRRVAARAVARASLAAGVRPAGASPHALAMTGASAANRATALLRPAPRHRPLVVGMAGAVLLLAGVGALHVGQATEHRFEVAHAVYVHP